MDAEMDGIATGLSNVICKDGQTTITANIPFNNRKITGLGDATADADALNRQSADARYILYPNALSALTTLDDADLFAFYDTGTAANKAITYGNLKAELVAENVAGVSSFNARTGDVLPASGDYTATNITNTPSGTIAATDVQTALNELGTEKAALASPAFTGTPTAPTAAGGTNTTQIATTAFVATNFHEKGGTDVPVTDGGTGSSTAAGARANLGLVIGTDVQAYDAELAALAGVSSAADRLPYFTGVGTASIATFTAMARNLINDADESAMRTTLGVAIGSDVQAYDAGLADIAALAVTDGNFIVGNGTNWVAESGATVRTSLGVTATGSDTTYNYRANNLSDVSNAATAFTNIKQAATTGTTGVVQVADQTAMEAETAGRAVTSDVAKHHPGVAKAWVSFNGATPAITGDFGVTSLTDNGAGDYTFTFDTAFSGATTYNHVSASSTATSSIAYALQVREISPPTTTTIRLRNDSSSGAGDPERAGVTLFGDQ